MICAIMEPPPSISPSQSPRFLHRKQQHEKNSHLQLLPEDESVIGPNTTPVSSSHTNESRRGASITSSMVAQAAFKSFSEDDVSNHKAQVIQRFVREYVLSSACRRAAFKKEKQNSILHPSLLLHDEDGSVVTRRVSSITMTDFEDSHSGGHESSHQFFHLGMKSNTVVLNRPSHDSKNTSSASSGHMSSLSEMSSHFGDFRFEPDAAHTSNTEPMQDGPLQMPTRAGSMSTISSHSYSTLSTQSTFSRGIAHLPATKEIVEEEDSTTSTSSEVKLENDATTEHRPNVSLDGLDKTPLTQHKKARSWDGLDTSRPSSTAAALPPGPPIDSPCQKPRRKSSFNARKDRSE